MREGKLWEFVEAQNIEEGDVIYWKQSQCTVLKAIGIDNRDNAIIHLAGKHNEIVERVYKTIEICRLVRPRHDPRILMLALEISCILRLCSRSNPEPTEREIHREIDRLVETAAKAMAPSDLANKLADEIRKELSDE